jgi:hypothetical protein
MELTLGALCARERLSRPGRFPDGSKGLEQIVIGVNEAGKEYRTALPPQNGFSPSILFSRHCLLIYVQ